MNEIHNDFSYGNIRGEIHETSFLAIPIAESSSACCNIHGSGHGDTVNQLDELIKEVHLLRKEVQEINYKLTVNREEEINNLLGLDV